MRRDLTLIRLSLRQKQFTGGVHFRFVPHFAEADGYL